MLSSLAKIVPVANFADGYRRAVAHLKLVKNGINVNRIHGYGLTALHRAAYDADLENFRLLLIVGANINARDADGKTPLHTLTTAHREEKWIPEKHVELYRLMVEHGADVNAADFFTRRPLHNAVDKCDIDLCRLLLDSGADPNAPWVTGTLKFPNENGHFNSETSLHSAAESGRIDLCQLLIEHGASPSWMRKENTYSDYLTPFQRVVKNGPVKLMRYFAEECGERLDQRTYNGRALIELAKEGSPEMAYLLSRETEHAILDVLPEGRDTAPQPPVKRSSGISPL